MARKSNKKERSESGRSKEWAIEVAVSAERHDNLARAIDLILNAAKGGDKTEFGGADPPDFTED